MREIPKQYDFNKSEEITYELWEKSGLFNPDNVKSLRKYSNVLPPPNANGELHVGHASGYAVMDIFARYNRMQGKKVLLLPGKDHAGIQTQVVFERKIKEDRGISRHDLGREEFYRECYDFTKSNSSYMRSQEKRIGISADWSREKFTLDSDVLKTAMETFVKMYEDGLVYKGKRIINWCPRCATALSDLEVIHQEKENKFYYIKYPLKDSKEFITVATTRPETMLGDTAVAINTNDKRYLPYLGSTIVLPLVGREIPIIADRRIEAEFGTGAVKITPAHDPLDWEIGKDHNLETIQVIDEKAEITKEGGKYEGLNVLEARKAIIKDLVELGLLEKEEVIPSSVSECERCKTTIEPLVSDQWFINVDAKKYSLKKEALKAIKAGKINFYPENFKKIMVQWLTDLDDWCISRQIWWGPRFPVWYKGDKTYVGLQAPKGEGWIQDENTFDTWFTSGQWAYTTLGFSKGKDFKNFYPTDTMIMGRDILFFWAARMIMLSLYRTKKVPFKNLYLTGLVRDKLGQKFSKSKGNGIDPLEMIERFGADALRLSLVMDIAPGQDTRIYEEKIENFRNFVTKLWNIARYCAQSDENFALIEKISKKDIRTLSDRWIISELEMTIKNVTEMMKNKNISLAQERLRKFTWDEFADWYVEINKIEKNTRILGYVFDKILRLWHPFTPFVTEEIYGIMTGEEKILMASEWPKPSVKFIDKRAKDGFEDLKDLIASIRNIRTVYHINPSETIEAHVAKIDEIPLIKKLAKVKIITDKESARMIPVASRKRIINLDIAKFIDVQKEISALEKEIKNLENLADKNEAMLKNKKFVQGAPKEVIEATKKRAEEYREKIEINEELILGLKKL